MKPFNNCDHLYYERRPNFTCPKCKKIIEDVAASDFLTIKGKKLHCRECAAASQKELFCVCARCYKIIPGEGVMAVDRNWHIRCFRCNGPCKRPLFKHGFYLHSGKVYCAKDYNILFAPICAGCNKRVTKNELRAHDKSWHKGCFKCTKCRKPLKDMDCFRVENDVVVCEKCSDLAAAKRTEKESKMQDKSAGKRANGWKPSGRAFGRRRNKHAANNDGEGGQQRASTAKKG